MNIITDEQRNLFNPYKNVSLIFKKKLSNKDNAYVRFDSEIRFDEESFSEKNFKQNIEVSISDMVASPLEHRNNIHPLANRAIQNCKLRFVMSVGHTECGGKGPQSIGFVIKDGYCSALLSIRVKDVAYINTFLVAMAQSTELSIKIDLLCDDSEFTKLDEGKDIQVIVHGVSISFNLAGTNGLAINT